MKERVYVIGCPVDCISKKEMLKIIMNNISKGEHCQVLGPNAAFAVMTANNPDYRELLESASHLPADGFWMAFAARVLGYKGVDHVGIERLVYEILPALAEMRGSAYLLGAKDSIVRKAAAAIENRYKGITVVGLRDGYFSEPDEAEVSS